MTPKTIPEPWQSLLKELDGTLSEPLSLHCIGGFVVTLVYEFSRTTSDIDVLVMITADDRFRTLIELGRQNSALHEKYGVYLDCVSVAKVPENYENRLTEIFPGTLNYLHLFALDPYDLALTKLERNEQHDRDDVRHLARTVPFDLKILKERYAQELRWQLGNPQREDRTLEFWIEAIEEERAKNKQSNTE